MDENRENQEPEISYRHTPVIYFYLNKYEKIIVIVMAIMMALVLLLSIIELGWIIIKDISSPPIFFLEIDELLEIFGLFMLVIIGIELLETIMKTYLLKNVNHVLVVMAVAIIALARKVIILNVDEMPGLTLVGLGAVIVSLSVGYYLIRRCRPDE